MISLKIKMQGLKNQNFTNCKFAIYDSLYNFLCRKIC